MLSGEALAADRGEGDEFDFASAEIDSKPHFLLARLD
jgi:hypothetical protein